MTHRIAHESFSHYRINIHGEVFDEEGRRQISDIYHGYRGFILTDNGGHKRLARLCRLLAYTFIPTINIPNPIVEHINHNTLDDRLENLRWNSQRNANLNREINYEDRHVETRILYQHLPPDVEPLDNAPHGARNKRITPNKYFFDFEIQHIVYRTRNGFKRLVYTNDDGNRRRCTLTAIDTITNAITKIQIANVDNFLDNIFN